MRTVNRNKVIAAKISGVAAALAHMRRLPVKQALAEITTVLAEAGTAPGTPRAQHLLSLATAGYVGRPDPATPGTSMPYRSWSTPGPTSTRLSGSGPRSRAGDDG